MAVSIPYGVAGSLLTKLATLAISEIVKVYGVENDLRRLQATLSTIKAVLLDAEEHQEQSASHAVKSWIRRLNEVMYDAEDVLDEIQYEVLRKKIESQKSVGKKVRKLFSSSNQIAAPLNMHLRIKDIRESLDGVAKDMSNFNFRERVIVEPRTDNSWRETDSFVVESEMVGREKDKENIVELLLHAGPDNNDSNVLAIAIVGFGGLGKTSLAQLVYNDTRVQRYFDEKMWVCVSDDFNVKLLVKKIIECLTRNEVLNLNLEELQRRLREKLQGKRYLLVLDDVWNENHQSWEQLKKYLLVGAPGSKILVTTRSKAVALVMDVESSYILEGLTEDQSWTLFKKLAFKKGQEAVSPRLVEIGGEIAKKCKGVPLAIRSLGSMMRLKSSEGEWLLVQKSDIWRLVESKNDIFPVLRLSYDHLPIYLRQCFSYCSMFPKDYIFDRETLIYLWMAQGYIQSLCEDEDLEDTGVRYFNELLVRSFFQECKSGRVFYKMHDLIHDLAILIAGDSCSAVGVDVSKMTRHIYLSCHPGTLESIKGVKTLFIGEHLYIDEEFFSNLKRLRVFCPLNGVISRKTFCNSIGNLKHLRYLDISENRDLVTLPDSITNLFYLETLIACGTLKRLPRDIGNLISLKYFMHKLPHVHTPVGLGKLTSLHKLSSFTPAGDGMVTLNELSSLNQLRGNIVIEKLEVAYRPHLQDILKEKKHLTALRLAWRPLSLFDTDGANYEDDLLLNSLEPHPNLQELYVGGYRGTRFSSWLSSITNLVRIEIRNCRYCRYLQPLEDLPSLQTLHLVELPSLEFISDNNESFSSSSTTTRTTFFPSLKEIKLDSCDYLKGWSRGRRMGDVVQMPPQSFPCLSTLFIDGCPDLASMPLFPSLDNDLSLITSSGRPLLDTIATTHATSASTSLSSSSVCTPLYKLKNLTLSRVHDVESGEWLKNLTSLKGLRIYYCSSLKSLSQGLQHLSSLEELEIGYCHELKLSNDEDENEEGMMHWQGLSSLQSLTIWDLPKLVSLPMGLQCITSLKILAFVACSNLIGLPDWIRNLVSLQELTIQDCPKVTSLVGISPLLSSLKTLSIIACGHLSRRYGNNKAKDWSKIAHIPNIIIDTEEIQEAGNYLLE